MAFERRPIQQLTSHDDFNNPGNQELVTWWHCGLIKAHKNGHQPKALVCFRKITSNDQLGDFIFRRIPLTELGQFEIGTIWKGQTSRQEIALSTAIFHLDFDANAWRHRTISELQSSAESEIIDPTIYQLPFDNLVSPSQVLQFPFSNDPIGLLVPSLTFFSRCYGRSQHVKRVLATYPLERAEEDLFVPLIEPAPPDSWAINLHQRAVNGDAVFLAHLKYDHYTRAQARRIWSQLQTAHKSADSAPIFPHIGPWFEGPARIRAKGLWLVKDKRFLALQITGCSDPDGAPIYRDRQNTNKTGPLKDGAEPGLSWQGAPAQFPRPRPPIRVTSDELPDTDSATLEIPDQPFELLGKPRSVIDIRRKNATSSNGGHSIGPAAERFSGDEAHGRNKGVGNGSFRASTVMESHGALRDVWNVLQKLKVEQPQLVQGVEYYDPSSGFSAGDEPQLIVLKPFTDEEKIGLESRMRNWPLLEPKNGIPRGALLARVLTPKGHVYFFEIERRTRLKVNPLKELSEPVEPDVKHASQITEDPFKGMVFRIDENGNLDIWRALLLDKIRYTCGVMDRLIGCCPGVAKAFIHKAPKPGQLPCEHSVRKALEKILAT